MFNAITVKWKDSDETVIKYSITFEFQDWVTKADILKDAIHLLTERYDSVLIKERDLRGETNVTV